MAKQSFKAIINAAVEIEEQSYALYKMAQEKVKLQSSKVFLEELAKEELKHKKKLLAIMEDKDKMSGLGSRVKQIQDLKIVDIMKDTSITEDADYQKILVFSAKREKATHEYYKSLASGLEDTEAGDLFSRLAQEELSHKNRLEREYDEYLLKEN
jgi:rubrerythrin